MLKLLQQIKQKKKDRIFSDYPCSDYLHNALKFLMNNNPDDAYEEICNALIRSGDKLSEKEEEFFKEIKTFREEKISRYVYEERDTMCDNCWMLHKKCIDMGLVTECTTREDTRKHYIPIPGGYCPGFVEKR